MAKWEMAHSTKRSKGLTIVAAGAWELRTRPESAHRRGKPAYNPVIGSSIYGPSGITHIPFCAFSRCGGIANLVSFEAIERRKQECG
jgi:hypothetical protein